MISDLKDPAVWNRYFENPSQYRPVLFLDLGLRSYNNLHFSPYLVIFGNRYVVRNHNVFILLLRISFWPDLFLGYCMMKRSGWLQNYSSKIEQLLFFLYILRIVKWFRPYKPIHHDFSFINRQKSRCHHETWSRQYAFFAWKKIIIFALDVSGESLKLFMEESRSNVSDQQAKSIWTILVS